MSLCLTANKLRLGFGCSGVWGERWFSESKARALVSAAIEGGVRHIDTAGFYGEAEARLGRAIKNISYDELFISTKTGTIYGGGRAPRKDFSAQAIAADVDASLKRLGRERLDLLYLHGPSGDEMCAAEPVLAQLKAAGKIAAAGVCGEGRFLDEAAGAPYVDVVMGAYNFLRREHEPIFAKAKANAKAVVAIAPLAQGLYRKDFFAPRRSADLWHLARALVKNRAELRRARDAAAALDEPGWTPAGLALGFVLANRDVDTAVTTTTRLDHLGETLAAARETMPAAALARLKALPPALDGAGLGA